MLYNLMTLIIMGAFIIAMSNETIQTVDEEIIGYTKPSLIYY